MSNPVGESEQRPKLDISPIQVIGGGLAAATAAAIGSKLGSAGTIIGAALISVIAAIAGALYTHTMRRTRHAARAALDRRSGRPAAASWAEAETAPLPRISEDDPAPTSQPNPPAKELPPPAERRRFPIRSVAIGTLAAFAIAAVLVVGLEFASGTSLAGTKGGTTVGDVTQGGGTKTRDDGDDPGRGASDPDSEEPSQQPSEQPSDEPSELPSEETTEEPSEQPTEQPSEEPTEDPGQQSDEPTDDPTEQPSEQPRDDQSEEPSDQPSDEPTEEPSQSPHSDSPPSDQ
ncbi:hypothetical protein [Microlunatus speluncae]|uniref:hypothetical protein n=1 Tax=Microlunatus speluncae TaxID=2594267 RepID=UPI00126645DF|nr:hypothetical protein [Microlunatus speluncae]